jgi:uncharacterized RDD family membrane protein YckC/cytoskeletal protein CcmA (bactofilin family)
MKNFHPFLLTLRLLVLSLALGPVLVAQTVEPSKPAEETQPAAPTAPASVTAAEAAASETPATPTPAPTPEPAVAVEAAPATPEAGVPAAETAAETADEPAELRRLDEPEAEVATADEAEVESGTAAAADGSAVKVKRRRQHSNQMPFGDHVIAEGSTVFEAVSVMGSTTVNGTVEGPAVSVFGDTRINGSTGREAVAVLGNVHINGIVGGEVVAVLGNVDLGPKADVKGNVVIIGGKLSRDPAATFKGDLQEIPIPMWNSERLVGLKTWFKECVLWGRPLAFGRNLGWAWMIAVAVFSMYVLLALLFPRAFEKCAQTLEERPGTSLLAVLLTILIIPVLVVLLVITGVGVLLLPFVIVGLILGSIFGKAVMHAWLGRRITCYFGPGPMQHAAVATFLGSVILLLLYTVPFLGFILFKVLGIIGLGVVVYTIILATRREKPPVVAVPAAGFGAAGATLAVPAEGVAAGAAEATMAPPPLATVAAAALPRAGFWIRLAASVLDAVLVGIVTAVTHTGSALPAIFAAYCVVMWAMKGTTIGGIICGLKVVRVDDRKVDWIVAVVRGLAGFLSLAVAGLGFLWVAFDDQKQSWHDKIAGTTIVRVPKGMALL